MKKMNQKGQGTAEYILLALLIALTIYAAVLIFSHPTPAGFNSPLPPAGGAATGH